MFKKASNSVCTSTIVLSPDLLSPTSSSSSALKTPENTEDPDDREPVDEGDTHIEYSCALLYNASIETVTKNNVKEHKVGIDIV